MAAVTDSFKSAAISSNGSAAHHPCKAPLMLVKQAA
jgi:hypothetical protein